MYAAILLRPGDQVTVTGTGCVQTGGSGRTWKRYVDPQGPGSGGAYYGTVWVEGPMPAPQPLRALTGPITVTLAQPLRLGYVDDTYGDNGYWGRTTTVFGRKFTDDGTGNQCRGLGNAVVTVRIVRPAPDATPLPQFAAQSVDVGALTGGVAQPLAPSGPAEDLDADGIPDAEEQQLAERFAPVVFHFGDEPNLPTRVDSVLAHTHLGVFDAGCTPEVVDAAAAPTAGGAGVVEAELARFRYESRCAWAGALSSGATRSRDKQQTFYLADVPAAARAGSRDPSAWVTYVHSYPTAGGGVALQYWRCYAYNTGVEVPLPPLPAVPGAATAQFGDHGGDWEGVTVVLDAARQPAEVRFTGHRTIDRRAWATVPHAGTHPIVVAARGSHGATPLAAEDTSTMWRLESWTGGQARAPTAGATSVTGGGLVMLGERRRPTRPFLTYSGLWGSPGFNFVRETPGLVKLGLHNISSGYWGPAFNETELGADGFVTAWCEGMDDSRLDLATECYAPASR